MIKLIILIIAYASLKCESKNLTSTSSFGSPFKTAIVGSSYSFDNSPSKSFSSYPTVSSSFTSFSSSASSVPKKFSLNQKSFSDKSDEYIDNLSKDTTDFLIKYSSDSSPSGSSFEFSSSLQPSSFYSSFQPASDLKTLENLSTSHSSQNPKKSVSLLSQSDYNKKDIIYGYSPSKPVSFFTKPATLISMTKSSLASKSFGFPVRASYTIPNLPPSKIISVYSSSSSSSSSSSPSPSPSPSFSSLPLSSLSSTSNSFSAFASDSSSPFSSNYETTNDHFHHSSDSLSNKFQTSSSHLYKPLSSKPHIYQSDFPLNYEITSSENFEKFIPSQASHLSYSTSSPNYASSSSSSSTDSKFSKPFNFFQSSNYYAQKPSEIIQSYEPPYESNEAKSNYISNLFKHKVYQKLYE